MVIIADYGRFYCKQVCVCVYMYVYMELCLGIKYTICVSLLSSYFDLNLFLKVKMIFFNFLYKKLLKYKAFDKI